jgi:hypothetical protein
MPRLHEGLESVARLTAAMGMDIPEQFARFGREWARADAKFYELNERKSAELARRAKALGGDLSVTAAEREVKASQAWHDFVSEIARAKYEANAAKVEMDYFAMKMQAWLTTQMHAREAEAA